MRKEEEKKRLLKGLKKEIELLEKEINPSKTLMLKKRMIFNSKIFLKLLQTVYPFFVASILMVGGSKLLGGGYPIIVDDEKKYLLSKDTIDGYGNVIEYEEQYVDSSYNYYDKVLYQSPLFVEGGEQRRIIEEFVLNGVTVAEVLSYFENEQNLEELLGSPISRLIQIVDEDEEALEKKLEVSVFGKNDDKYIIGKEAKITNNTNTVIFFILLIIMEGVIYGYRKTTPCLTDEYIEELRRKYIELPKSRKKELVKIYELKKQNYNLLTRGMKNGK